MTEPLDRLRAGTKADLSRALAGLEQAEEAVETATLLDAAFAAPRGHVLGLTGPPGVGKSTLIRRLIGLWRDRGETVGVIAVDPTSQATGGALLGDRTRFKTDPGDQGVFVRSMAARDRLGGLAALTFPATMLMRALFDHVIVETVGVGQSETDVGRIADTVIFCIQPGSGDSLQFMKAGIMEVPDIFLVTKADTGALADKAAADVEGALSLTTAPNDRAWMPPVLTVSAERSTGLDAVLDAVTTHWQWLQQADRLRRQRTAQARSWLDEAVKERFGTAGAALVADLPAGMSGGGIFAARQTMLAELEIRRRT